MITIEKENVMLDGEHIGTINGETAEMLRAIGPKVKGEINAAHGSKLKYFLPEADDEPPDLGGPVKPSASSVTVSLTPAEQRAAKLAPFLHLQSAAMGDKTPAFVDAARDVLTAEEFSAHYGNRRIPADQRAYEDGERKRHGKLQDEKKDDADA